MSRPRRRRRWADLGQVERVDLYTRQSLYWVLASVNAALLASGASELDDGAQVAELLAGGTIVTLAGLWLLRSMLTRHPAQERLPRMPVAVLLLTSATYLLFSAAAGWTNPPQVVAVLVVGASLGVGLGIVPDHRVALAILVGVGVAAGVLAPDVVAVGVTVLVTAVFILTSRASMWLFGIVRDLDEARRAQGELAVMEERLRFSRDVHDVLGRRLSMIAVQAELAATLAQRGDERAPDQMLEVRAVAHEALREARELARGYRATTFGQELEGARSLLRSAGIEVRLDVEAMPQAWHEAAAWVVRESITNVLRHSAATTVEIVWSGGHLRIDNDGVRPGTPGDGAGLQGLRERLAPLGGSLLAQPAGVDGWSVVAVLPGTGPLSAQAARGVDA